MPYDRDSGVVYKESTISLKQSECHCERATRCIRIRERVRLPWQGARSLGEVAMYRVLDNLNQLEPSTLRALPESVVENIFQAARRDSLVSVRTWQLFAHTHLGTEAFKKTWPIGHCPRHQLPYYVDVAAVSECWLTDLRFSSGHVAAQDLVYVAKLRNVRSIYSGGYSGGKHRGDMSDRTIRGWAQAFREEGAFSNLGVLILDVCKDVTVHSLEPLASLPTLHTFCANDCGLSDRMVQDHTNRDPAWLVEHEDTMTSFANDKSLHNWPVTVRLYIEHRSRHIIRPKAAKNRPTLTLDFNFRHNTGYEPSSRICLTRDFTVAASASDMKFDGHDLMSHRSMPKRRKIKDGKSVALNDMLAGM